MLEHLTVAERLGAFLLLLCTLVGVVWGWLTKVRPRIGRIFEVWEALTELLFGRPEEPPNPITGAPAVPGVLGIGPRLTEQEHTTALLVENVALLTRQQSSTEEMVRQLADLRHELGEVRARLDVLEEARVERVVAQAESAAMWSAIAHEQQPDQPTPPQPGDDTKEIQ